MSDHVVRARQWTALGRVARAAPLAVVIVVVTFFVVVPLVALFSYQPLGRAFDEMSSSVAMDAIIVTAKTNAIAMALTLGFGTPFAYVIGRRRFPGRSALITLVELPLVMPPAVAGIALLVAFGRLGLLGGALSALGIDLAFTPAAVVMAIVFVASPFYIRGAIGAFEALDATLIDVAGTLGAGPLRRMLRVALPLARSGLAAAGALASHAGSASSAPRSSLPGASREPRRPSRSRCTRCLTRTSTRPWRSACCWSSSAV